MMKDFLHYCKHSLILQGGGGTDSGIVAPHTHSTSVDLMREREHRPEVGGSGGRSNMQPCSPGMGIALASPPPFLLPFPTTTLPLLLFCVIPPYHLTPPPIYTPIITSPLPSTPHHHLTPSHLHPTTTSPPYTPPPHPSCNSLGMGYWDMNNIHCW